MSSQSAGRRRSNMRQYSAEDQALNMISKEAESRLAAKRAARAEAREIRLKEMEKQQRESEAKQDRVYELTNEHNAVKSRQMSGSRSGSRRGSTESNESETKDMDFKLELRELEEKYKAAMMTSAQLDNEKQSLVYQVELLKDQLEEQDEGFTELQRQYKDKCRDFDFQKRDLQSMEHELSILKQQLEIKDRLIEESGFVILSNDRGEPVLTRQTSGSSSTNGPLPSGAVLVSQETKDFLEKAGGGTLGTAISEPDHVACTNNISVDNKTNVPSTNQVSDLSICNVTPTVEVYCLGDSVDTVDSPLRLADVNSNLEGSGSMHDSSSVVSTNLTITNDIGQSPMWDQSQNASSESGARLRVVGSRSARVSGTDDSDEGEEFYDAETTPSPYEERTFDIGIESTGTTNLAELTGSERTEGSACSTVQIKSLDPVQQSDLQDTTASENSLEADNKNDPAKSKSSTEEVIGQDMDTEKKSTFEEQNFDPSENKQSECGALEKKDELIALDSEVGEPEAHLSKLRQEKVLCESNDIVAEIKQSNVPATLEANEVESNEKNDRVSPLQTENQPSSKMSLNDEYEQTLESEIQKFNTQLSKESNVTEGGINDDFNDTPHDMDSTKETDNETELITTNQSKQEHESAQTVGKEVENSDEILREEEGVVIEQHGDTESFDYNSHEAKEEDMSILSDSFKPRELESQLEEAPNEESDEDKNVEAIEVPKNFIVCKESDVQELASEIERASEQNQEETDIEEKSAINPEENPLSSNKLQENELSIGDDIIDYCVTEVDENETKIDLDGDKNSEDDKALILPVWHEIEDDKKAIDIPDSPVNNNELGSSKMVGIQNETEMKTVTPAESVRESRSFGNEEFQIRPTAEMLNQNEECNFTAPGDESQFSIESFSNSINSNTLTQEECKEGMKTHVKEAKSYQLQDKAEEKQVNVKANQNDNVEITSSKMQDSGSPSTQELGNGLEKSEKSVESDENICSLRSECVKHTSRISESFSEGEVATEYGFDDIDEELDTIDDKSSLFKTPADEMLCSTLDDNPLKAEGDREATAESTPPVSKKEKKESKAKSKRVSVKKTSVDESKKHSFFWSKKSVPENSTPTKENKGKTGKKSGESPSGSSLSVNTLTESSLGETSSKASSYSSLEPDDLEKALDKQITEKPLKKSKKESFFKKVFK